MHRAHQLWTVCCHGPAGATFAVAHSLADADAAARTLAAEAGVSGTTAVVVGPTPTDRAPAWARDLTPEED